MTITNRNMVVEVCKEPCDENHPYATFDVEAMSKAAQELNASAFKLWCYLAANQNGDSSDFSPADAAKWGIARSSFYRAKDELTQLGYIKCLEGNIFTFCKNPSSNF